MAGTAVRGGLKWLLAEVLELQDETARVRTIVLRCPGWAGHSPGQHIDIRLTAEDGYQAQRSYSLAAPQNGDTLVIAVERVEGGEVSPYLAGELRPGDKIELRGPIGRYFVWEPSDGGPLQLIGGGSGVVPLVAILRHLVGTRDETPVRYLSSARSHDELLYLDELSKLAANDGVAITHTLTRQHPTDWGGHTRRIDRRMLEQEAWTSSVDPLCFVCGPTGFVESVAADLVDLGYRPERVRTERFGPTGRTS